MWISKIYWTWSPHDCLVYILCTITNCAVHFKPRGVTWGEDYCVLQCTLKTWFHPISFSKKCKVMKTLLNFYPKYYPRLSCTMIDVSAHYGIPPPKKISSYAFIVYYTKYLIFILSHLLNLNNLWLRYKVFNIQVYACLIWTLVWFSKLAMVYMREREGKRYSLQNL